MIFLSNKFTGHWPIGTAAAVSADSPEEAADFLNETLKKAGLPGDAESGEMIPISDKIKQVVILNDGDY